MRRSALVFLSLLVTSSAALGACGGPSGAGATGGETPKQPAPVAGDAASGEALYAELGCKGCHGAKGEKETVGPNLFALTWDDHERAEAHETILKGKPDHKPPMPGYAAKVDDAKIADLLAYFAQK